MWLDQLKIAIVEADSNLLETLLQNTPTLQESKEIESALYLLEAAKEMLQSKKVAAQADMQKIKKTIQFLQSTSRSKKAKIDIKF